MKKISIALTFGLLFYSNITQPNSNQSYAAFCDEDDDDFFSDDPLNNISLTNSDSFKIATHRGSSENIALWALGLQSLSNPEALLNQNIYNYTAPLRTRPILEYPFALTYGFDTQEGNSVSAMLFVNTTPAKNFTKDSTHLDSYLDINNQDRIDILEEIAAFIPDDQPITIGDSLALFAPLKVLEARIGILFEAHVVRNKLSMTAQLPVLYTARKLSLTQAEEAAIDSSPLAALLVGDGSINPDTFKRQHFGVDQVGFGDFKFKMMYECHRSDVFDVYFGGFVILPTEHAFHTGLIGASLPQNNVRPTINLANIDPTNVTLANKDAIADFFLATLDKLASNILYSPLGNNSHVVIAPSLNFDWFFTDRWNFASDYSLQIPFPGPEARFYKKVQSAAAFTAEFNAASAESDAALVEFANQKIEDLFIPYVFNTSVFPGIVINSTNQFVYDHNQWDFAFGANFWYQSAEKLQNINLPQNGSPASADYNYDMAAATAHSVAQEKLFAKINYTLDHTNYSWSLSAYGDITIWNSGIGNDFTLGICADCRF